MIEAACTACGTVNRIADADVPLGAKFVNCASCKSRVALPARAAAPAPGAPLDFADLPAPRRQSPLGAATPRAGVETASEPGLPAPRAKKTPTTAPAAPVELDDLLGYAGVYLPAPRPKVV